MAPVVVIDPSPLGVPSGIVSFGGIRKEICLAYVPDVVVGDYTIVHVGFALTKLDETSALETLELFRSVGLLDEELNVVQTPTGPTSAAG